MARELRIRCRVLTPESPVSARWIEDALVVVEGGRFTAVAPYDGSPVDEDLRPAVLTPGFVDSHVHFPQTRIVGAASGPLLDWLATSTFPEEERFADPHHARQVAGWFCDRLLASGTTFAMVYSSVHPHACDVLLETMAERGLRGIAGPVLMDTHCPDALQLPVGPAMDGLAELVDRWNGHEDRLQVGVIPRFALCCTREMLHRAGAFARENDLWVTTHLSENLEECRVAREMFDAPDYLSIYEEAGLLHDRSVYAHCIHLSDDEWGRFATAGAAVAHCPDSNDFLGSGGMPTAAVQAREIPITIGSDVAAGRSFRIPRILSSAYDNGLRQGVSLDPRQLLWWGTRGGALAFGQSDIGAVAVGHQADFVALDVPAWATTEDEVLGWVLFDHDGRVQRTWIGGVETFRVDTASRL